MNIWSYILIINALLLTFCWLIGAFTYKKGIKGWAVTLLCIGTMHLIAYFAMDNFLFPIQAGTYLNYFLYPNLIANFFLLVLVIRPKTERLEKRRQENIPMPYRPGRYDFCLRTTDGKHVRYSDPFDNWLVYAGANSGKTKSIGYQLLDNYVAHNFAGLLYDYKENDYGRFLVALMEKYPNYANQVYFVNFHDPSRSSRFNLLKPSLFASHTEMTQVVEDIFMNYAGQQNDPTWFNASMMLVKAVATLFYYEHPELCTLPFIYNFILHNDIEKVVDRCEDNMFSSSYVRTIKSVLSSPKTLGSMNFTLFPLLADTANNQELCYVLNGDDFDFNLIDPAHPKLVCLANSRKVESILSPIMGATIRASTRPFTIDNKVDFFYLMDEATTFSVKDFENMPSLLREYRASFTFITQSSQKIVLRYSREAKSSIESNFGNQIFGKTKDVQAAKDYSLVFEKALEQSRNQTRGSNRAGSSSSNTDSLRSVSKYEISDFTTLETGRFIGSSLHSNYREFNKSFQMSDVEQADHIPKVRELDAMDIRKHHQQLVKKARNF